LAEPSGLHRFTISLLACFALTCRALRFLRGSLRLAFPLAWYRHQHLALARGSLLGLAALRRLGAIVLADIVQAFAQRIHQVDDVAAVARLGRGPDRFALALLVQEYNRWVAGPAIVELVTF
jgi:hypothetical protein